MHHEYTSLKIKKANLILAVTTKDLGIKCLVKYLIKRSGQNIGFYLS